MSRFSDIIRRGNLRAVETPQPPPPPSKEELLESDLRLLANQDEPFRILSDWFDQCISRTKAQEAAALSNHPLMCHYHGQVVAFESLKTYLSVLRKSL